MLAAILNLMRVVLAYIVVTGGPLTHEYAARFVASYLTFPPGAEHETVVVCNGGPPPHETGLLFAPLNAKFFPRVNDPGWDLTAYMDVAAKCPCDALLCCGESVWFHREGWLKRLVEAWEQHGPGMYGLWASYLLRPHLVTTAFMTAPKCLTSYPRPTNKKERYAAEHGIYPLWKWVAKQKGATKLVTWDGEWDPSQWRTPDNGLWRGDQSNCLAHCIHTDRWFEQDAKKRSDWSKGADGVYKTLPI